MKNKLLKSLSVWFYIHFIVDVLFAIPLMFFPEITLSLLEWVNIDPVTTRIVSAALFAIGIESFFGKNSDVETFKAILNLKIIWSGCALSGLLLSLLQGYQGRPWSIYLFLLIFTGFNIVWVYFRVNLKNC